MAVLVLERVDMSENTTLDRGYMDEKYGMERGDNPSHPSRPARNPAPMGYPYGLAYEWFAMELHLKICRKDWKE